MNHFSVNAYIFFLMSYTFLYYLNEYQIILLCEILSLEIIHFVTLYISRHPQLNSIIYITITNFYINIINTSIAYMINYDDYMF